MNPSEALSLPPRSAGSCRYCTPHTALPHALGMRAVGKGQETGPVLHAGPGHRPYSVVREVGIRLRDTGAVGSCVELNAFRCRRPQALDSLRTR